MCSPADDKYLKKGKRCKQCGPCPLGKGRNLTQAKQNRDSLDNTKCLRCETCPPGTFNDGRGMTSECRPCTEHKCNNLNRNVQIQCSNTQDHVCGACKFGYSEERFRDVKYSCHKKTTIKTPSVQPATPSVNEGPSRVAKLQGGTLHQQHNNNSYGMNMTIILSIFGVLGLISLILIGIFVLLRKRRGCPPTNSQHTAERGDYTQVPGYSSSTLTSSGSDCSSLLQTYDAKIELETDGPTDNKKIGHELANHAVRGELASVSIDQSNVGGRPVEGTGLSAAYQLVHGNFDKKCTCHPNQCGLLCKESSLDDELANIGDHSLREIAYNICHDPTEFFRDLGVKDAEVYNLDNDRTRSPDKVTQRNFIHSVLKRWVELQGREAKYSKLRMSLCKNGFHRVNTGVFHTES